MDTSTKILSDIIIYMKYAKFIEKLNRRETWEELVLRNKQMHLMKFPNLKSEIDFAYDFVLTKKILPSMRSMQFAGKPIEISPNRIYNCGYLPMDDWRAFHEIMFLLLGGCFDGDTEIKTKNGNKKIKDITLDDEILTFDSVGGKYEYVKPVYSGKIARSIDKNKLELELEDGTIIRCTEDHRFLTTNRGWIEAKDLTATDNIENYFE